MAPSVAAQPRLATAGVLSTIAGFLAPVFDGVDDYLLSANPWGLWAAGQATMMGVLSAPSGQINKGIMSEANSAAAQGQYTLQAGQSSDASRAATNVQTQSGTALGTANATGVFDGGLHHVGWVDTGSSNIVRRDETASAGVSYARGGATLAPDRAAMGAIPRASVSGFFGGSVLEFVLYPTALDDSVRKQLAADQRGFYGTP